MVCFERNSQKRIDEGGEEACEKCAKHSEHNVLCGKAHIKPCDGANGHHTLHAKIQVARFFRDNFAERAKHQGRASQKRGVQKVNKGVHLALPPFLRNAKE